MKKIIIVSLFITSLLFVGCDDDPNLITNIETCSVEGTIILENTTLDTINAKIQIISSDYESMIWETEVDSTGYFLIENLSPGYFSINYIINSRHFVNQSATFELFKDDNLVFEELFFPIINNDCGIEGYITFEAQTQVTDIEIYYQENEEFIIDRTIQSDENGFYETNNLFPGKHKLVFNAENYAEVILYPDLLPGEVSIIDTVYFEEIVLIQQNSISIDGNLDDWGQPLYTNNHTSSWGITNDFADLYLAFDNDSLYVALSGGFSDTENTINLYLDTTADSVGINDFSIIQGGDIGNHLRKTVTCPAYFGADFAFSGWALQYNVCLVSLEDPATVDTAIITSNVIARTDVIEIAIPLNEIFVDGMIPPHRELSLVAIIGGGNDVSIADDSIPQQENVLDFDSVFTAKFAE